MTAAGAIVTTTMTTITTVEGDTMASHCKYRSLVGSRTDFISIEFH